MDIAVRAAAMFDSLTVAVCDNPSKKPLFTFPERLMLIKQALPGEPKISCVSFSGLLTDFCRVIGARYIVRGIRNGIDYTYEAELAKTYKSLSPDVECVYLMSDNTSNVSGTTVRELLSYGADVSGFVPEKSVKLLKELYKSKI